MDIVQENIVAEFKNLPTWEDKYEKIILLGKKLPSLSVKDKTEDNKVSGCTSRVWLLAKQENGLLVFKSDSDSLMVKGLVGLLLEIYSNKAPQQILDTKPYFIEQIGLQNHLSPTRTNGLLAVLKQIKLYALGYQSIQKNSLAQSQKLP